MVPLRDVSRRPAHFPVVTLSIIAVNMVVFWLELNGGERFITRWTLVPADLVAGRHGITLLTAMFLHGGWLHLLGNMLFLWVFGPTIEDAMGRGRYLGFYLLSGAVASLAQVAAAPASTLPILGASGAIAAVMGAFLVTYPRDQIKTILFLGIFFTVTRVRAIVLVGVWFLLQILSARVMRTTSDASQGSVAYFAHIAGFLMGAITARFLVDPDRIAEQAEVELE